MRYRKSRRFRSRSNGRGHHPSRNNGVDSTRLRSPSFSNDRGRNNFKSYHSAEKLADKYNALAKEALSSGDRILSENYLQHADHFTRVISEKSLNQNQNKTQITSNTKDQITPSTAEKRLDSISNTNNTDQIKKETIE